MHHPIQTFVRPIQRQKTLGEAQAAAEVSIGIGTILSLLILGFAIYGIVKYSQSRRSR